MTENGRFGNTRIGKNINVTYNPISYEEKYIDVNVFNGDVEDFNAYLQLNSYRND